MVEQIFLSPHVKQIVIISNKLELPQELPRLRILGKYGTSGTSQNSIELLLSAQSSPRNEKFCQS